MEEEKGRDLLHVINARNIRELVNKVNSLNIPRQDVVKIMKTNDNYVLIYYCKET